MPSHNARPTLGHPTLTAAIVALHVDGCTNMAIRERTGASRGAVGRAIHEYRWMSGLPVTTRTYRAKDVVRGERW